MRPLARAHPDILCAIITDGCQGAAVSSKLSRGMLFAFVIYPIGDVKLDEPTLTLAYLCILSSASCCTVATFQSDTKVSLLLHHCI